MTYQLLKELKEPSVIYQDNPDDPNNPEVLVKGVGRYHLNTLEKDVQSKLEDLASRAVRANDYDAWKQVEWMLNHAAMREMVKTIVSAKKEIKGVKESFTGPGKFEVDGYELDQYDEEELDQDNMKIFHAAKAPGESQSTILDHTPYEYLSKDDFAKYVEYHKKYGKWPKHPTQTNWDQKSLHELIDGLNEVFKLPRFKKNSEKEELLRRINRLGEFIKERERELEAARAEIERLQGYSDADAANDEDDVPAATGRLK